KRFGQTVTIAASRFADGPAASDAEVKTFYTRNLARYTVPETRVVRYAVIDRTRIDAASVPTEDQITKAYTAKASLYSARQTRVLTQAIVQDAAKAKALAAQVTGGADFAAAAKAAGSDAITLDPQEEKGFATMSSADVAKVAFAAAKGAVAGPVKSPLGWHIIRVDGVTMIGGKSLPQVRGELVTALTSENREKNFANLVNTMLDTIRDGKSFDDLVKANGLTALTTASVTKGGIAPDGSAKPLDPALQPVLADAFTGEPDDDPAVVAIDKGVRQVLYDLESVKPAEPKVLATVHDLVVADFGADRAGRAARKAATDLVTQVNKGLPLAKALADAGLGGAQPVAGQRDKVQQDKAAPIALKTLFELTRGKAKMIESADHGSWTVVALERLEQSNASQNPILINAVRQQLSDVAGREYADQMVAAIRAEIGVTRNVQVIAQSKGGLQKPGGQ
ncbi:MAG: hypothetical protein RL367_2377, partial [Pseudomonadota bacterium]